MTTFSRLTRLLPGVLALAALPSLAAGQERPTAPMLPAAPQSLKVAKPAPATKSAPSKSEDAKDPGSKYLDLERAASSRVPELLRGLTPPAPFSKRLPPNWGVLPLTQRQKNDLYRIEQDYYEAIAQLQARIARLEAERDARMRANLKPRQREQLDRATAEAAEKKRLRKEAERAAKDAKEEEELNEEEE